MPTKHIDDKTASELDELYVRCVTLTQQPVKEVEVIRLAIQKGIGNITNNDILSEMSVKGSVWNAMANSVLNEITARWPEEGIDADNFRQLAAELSPTWNDHPGEKCQNSIRDVLKQTHLLGDTLEDRLFTSFDPLTDGPDLLSKKELEQKNLKFDDLLPSFQGKKISEQEQKHRDFLMLRALKKQGVNLLPDGTGDFVVEVNTPPTPNA